MQLTKLSADGDDPCHDGKTCPAVYNTDTDIVLVQGTAMTHPDAMMATHEGLVAVPKTLLRALAGQLSEL